MPDYIYLLENRLSADQQNALRQMREAAREAGMILFLTGDAVRDLTGGHAVRELEVAVHGNALKLKKSLERLGGQVWGEDETARSLYLCFPGTVRVDVVSTHRTEFPKPGQPVYHPASIQEDLRRRDFTVNAMAISLNEGSFGLLMDPTNGAADIEARTLRLVSNYGFLEEPSLLIRATRYKARLGWELDPRTQTRFENAKGDGVIEFLSAEARSRELEQIGHEEDALKVLRAVEAEGWMKFLFPAWSAAKADEEKLEALHKLAIELLAQGVHADMSAAQMQLLTAKLAAKDLAELKKTMLRPGFVQEWNSLDAMAAGFAKVLLAKENATPSTSYKLFTSYDPEAVLWLGFTSKEKPVQDRFNLFLKVWPEARQRIPHALMQEMRITPELATYSEILQTMFLELIDGRLTTTEELRAFLEPYSPPAPPPQVSVKRPRKRGEAKAKEPAYDEEDEESEAEEEEDLDDMGGDDDDLDLEIAMPKADVEADEAEGEGEDEDSEPEEEAPVAKRAGRTAAPAKKAKEPAAAAHAVRHETVAEKAVADRNGKAPAAVKASKPAQGKAVQHDLKTATAKAVPVHPEKSAKSAKAEEVHPAKPTLHAPAKAVAKPAAKGPLQGSVKPPIRATVKAVKAPAKSAPVKGKPAVPAKNVKAAAKGAKVASKGPAGKAAKKH